MSNPILRMKHLPPGDEPPKQSPLSESLYTTVNATVPLAPLDAEHFDDCKEKIATILSKVYNELPLILGNYITLQSREISQDKINTIFASPLISFKSLSDYDGPFLSSSTSRGYKVLGDICHDLKRSIQNIVNLILLSNINNKDEIIQSLIYFIEGIKEYKDKISSLSFFADEMLCKDIFSPAKNVDGIFHQFPGIIQKGITSKNNIPKEEILSYREIFNVVMHNLIANAVKFTPNEGVISVGLDQSHPDHFTFYVQDSGVGIPDDADVFVEGYTTVSPDGQIGTGRGLPACKGFLTEIGGNITHEKGPDGVGTTFTFTLPRKGS